MPSRERDASQTFRIWIPLRIVSGGPTPAHATLSSNPLWLGTVAAATTATWTTTAGQHGTTGVHLSVTCAIICIGDFALRGQLGRARTGSSVDGLIPFDAIDNVDMSGFALILPTNGSVMTEPGSRVVDVFADSAFVNPGLFGNLRVSLTPPDPLNPASTWSVNATINSMTTGANTYVLPHAPTSGGFVNFNRIA